MGGGFPTPSRKDGAQLTRSCGLPTPSLTRPCSQAAAGVWGICSLGPADTREGLPASPRADGATRLWGSAHQVPGRLRADLRKLHFRNRKWAGHPRSGRALAHHVPGAPVTATSRSRRFGVCLCVYNMCIHACTRVLLVCTCAHTCTLIYVSHMHTLRIGCPVCMCRHIHSCAHHTCASMCIHMHAYVVMDICISKHTCHAHCM